MSTRGIYTFVDNLTGGKPGLFHVYVHSDNYPTGGLEKIADTLNSDKLLGLSEAILWAEKRGQE